MLNQEIGTTHVETNFGFVDKNVTNNGTSGSNKTQKTRYIYQKGTNIFLMCRVCLTQSSSNMYELDKKFEIDSETVKNILVVEALQQITYSKVPLNGVYPQYLCPMCMSLLKMCYKFIVQFQESQLKLKELYNIYETENIEDDYVDDNDNKENDENDRKATVEVIYNNKKFNLNELLVVEAAESEDNNYKGFLNNLGKEVSATFADKGPKDKSTNKDEELVSISIKENDRIVPIKELQLDEDANLVNYIVDESTLQQGETLKFKELSESSYDILKNNQYIEIDLENNDIIESLIIERDSGTDSKELDNGYLHVPIITKYDRRKKGNGNNSTHDVFDEEIKFPCEICSRIFSTIRLLKAHVRRTHFPNKKRYSCEICGYVNNTRSAYMNHKLKHAGKQFACDICKKPYYTKAVLKVHMETHVNSRQHLCSVCGKSFNYANALVYHMRLHTGEKNYKCEFCNTSFRMQSALRRHVRVHTGEKPYKCAYCDKSFCSKGEVSCHENIHTGFRPYHCKYCKKGFTKTHNLKLHLLSHDGPHQCEICAKSFIEMAILVMHYKIAHKNMLPGSDEETEMKDEDA